MPNSAIVKTGWARKKREIILLLAAVAAIVIAVFAVKGPVERTALIGTQNFSLEVVSTEGERSRGLSGRASLSPSEGMLFVFEEEEGHCIWMKDMNFTIDVLWTDSKRKVVHMEHGLTPESYPQNFCSPSPAAYVIELPAGSIERSGVRQGQVLNF